MNTAIFNEFARTAPSAVNVEAIRCAWQALAPPYDIDHWLLPLPVWAQRPYEDSGPDAWDNLCQDISATMAVKPMCLYMHVPFCSSKCGYCDCYSFKLGSHRTERIQEYADRLCYELQVWSEVGNLRQRPVSTVHLGGGTPAFLGEAALTQIVECCKTCFAVSDATEWALESTVESLTPAMIITLHQLGYRRLHIGVESLEDQVRTLIGRRRPGAEVLERIQTVRELGWVVSVDLICGLPQQTLRGFISGIQSLIEAGSAGFSLYELLIYPQNQRWAEQYGLTARSHLPNYLIFQAGVGVLREHGYTLNIFNHWACQSDTNLYFTFPVRGEDCLAIGTIADGVFGDYHYRHPRYMPYLHTCHSGFPGLEGGLRRNAYENDLHPVITAILSGHLAPELLPDLQTPVAAGGSTSLLETWQELALVESNGYGGLQLTANGSWFAGTMIKELVGNSK